MKKEQVTQIWRKYQSGKDQHNLTGMYEKTERCHRFYEGEQWHGLQSGGEELPVLNFIRSVCTYKIAVVAMNNTEIIFSSIGKSGKAARLCSSLTQLAAAQWEREKMDRLKWEIVKNSCITGDQYVYCYDDRKQSGAVVQRLTPKIKLRLVGKTDIYFANEQCADIQAQEWIIIAQRAGVSDIKKTATQNGLSREEISQITAENATEADIGVSDFNEVKSGEGKCTSLLYMRKTDKGIEFCRSTKNVIYQKPTLIPNLFAYPVCGMRWLSKAGSARGVGVVEGMIANQLEVNRTLARRSVMVKKNGFANIVYDQDKIIDPDSLGKAGASIAVRNLSANPISSLVQYLTPAPMTSDAANLQHELINITRELEGASDAATGQVDPTKASGEAIKAARDQSAINLNEQMAAYKQFVEDLAIIWYQMWKAYSPRGIMLLDKTVIAPAELSDIEVDIRIDVSPSDPYSRLAREISLENALAKGHISFEEYIWALDENSGVPKDKFNQILKRREAKPQPAPENPESLQALPQTENMNGGMPNEVPYM